jgi:hypothetical protein
MIFNLSILLQVQRIEANLEHQITVEKERVTALEHNLETIILEKLVLVHERKKGQLLLHLTLILPLTFSLTFCLTFPVTLILTLTVTLTLTLKITFRVKTAVGGL